jgi:RNA polymerase sigma-70 factor (ECF subfamily)
VGQSPEANRQLREVQALFIKHQPAVRAMAIALTGDFSMAEDIVQETFITVTEKAGSFTLGTNFSAWVGTIVRYKVLQKHRPWPRLSSEVIESLTAGASPEAEDDRLSALLTCLEELPPRARELIRLRYYGEHGPQEIAGLLRRSVAGVNAALVKARDLLRGCVRRKLAAEEVPHVSW